MSHTLNIHRLVFFFLFTLSIESQAQTVGPNLIVNGTFSVAQGWQSLTNGSIVNGYARVGKAAGGIGQSVKVKAGTKYRLSGEGWLGVVAEPASFRLEFKNAAGVVLARTSMTISATLKQKRTVELVAPVNSVTAYISFLKQVGTTAYAFADNVQFAAITPVAGPVPIIPGGVGFGMQTAAGSGRNFTPINTTVYKVTHLNATGPGSFQACVYAKGPRVCVFEVSGTIDLTGDKMNGQDKLSIENPYLTIAGQTAPPPGITIKGKTIRLEAHNVLIQHIRIRVGDSPMGATPYENRDGFVIIGSMDKPESERPHNIVIDHVSASWGIDETFTVKDTARNVTLTNNLVTEGLRQSLHPKGSHSKGMMISGNYLTVAGNLISNIDDRGPLETSPNAVVVNNLTYNSTMVGMYMSPLDNNSIYASASRKNTVARNVRIPGPQTPTSASKHQWVTIAETRAGSQIYAAENLCGSFANSAWPCVTYLTQNAAKVLAMKVTKPPIWNSGLKFLPVAQVKDAVLANAGARPLDRDAVDKRVVNEVKTGTGKIPNCVESKTLYYPTGNVLKAAATSVDIPMEFCAANGTLLKREIQIVSGKGAGQARVFSAQACMTGAARGTVSAAWTTIPDATSVFRVKQDCTSNAGGWPVLKSQTRK
ncbi:MAG: hypothetical protein AABZ31_09725, partial [Bdellovibrionota bacterium]